MCWVQEKNQDAIRDLQIKQLSAAKESEKHAEMLAELLAAHPAHIPLLSEAMQRAVRRHSLLTDVMLLSEQPFLWLPRAVDDWRA